MVPALAAGFCQIWWAHAGAATEPLLDLLDEHERRRYSRYVRGQDRALFLVAHALVRILAARHCAAEPPAIRFATGGPGAKPCFAGAASELELSISHSGRRAVVALSRGVALGVDVERKGRVGSPGQERSLAESVLTSSELRALAVLEPPSRQWGFYRYWTRKEAILKATGDGLAVPPKLIVVSPPTDPPALTRWAGPRRPAGPIHLYDLEAGPGYAAALAAIGSPLELTVHDGSAILRGWNRAGARAASRGG
jgi:4'-phosphopantetheinyl transferase